MTGIDRITPDYLASILRSDRYKGRLVKAADMSQIEGNNTGFMVKREREGGRHEFSPVYRWTGETALSRTPWTDETFANAYKKIFGASYEEDRWRFEGIPLLNRVDRVEEELLRFYEIEGTQEPPVIITDPRDFRNVLGDTYPVMNTLFRPGRLTPTYHDLRRVNNVKKGEHEKGYGLHVWPITIACSSDPEDAHKIRMFFVQEKGRRRLHKPEIEAAAKMMERAQNPEDLPPLINPLEAAGYVASDTVFNRGSGEYGSLAFLDRFARE